MFSSDRGAAAQACLSQICKRRDREVVSLGACPMATVIAQLTWIDRKGNEHTRTADAMVLANQLKTLRSEAKLTLLNGRVIGECTRLEGLKPGQVPRWVWSYNLAVLEKESKDSYTRERKCALGETPCANCRNSHHKKCRVHLKDGTPCSCSCSGHQKTRQRLTVKTQRC